MRGRYTRAGSASLHLFKGRWGWLDVSIEGRAWLNVAYLQLEVRDRRARAGSVAPLHPLKRQRDSFAARLDVSIEGRACWFAFDELDVACLQNRRCVAVARRRGASLPCIPSRGGEVLLLRGWAFLLRVAHSIPMERLGRAGCRLFAESEVCGRRARAGSVAPLHPHEGRRGSFVARLGVSIEGSAQRSDGAFGTSRALLVCGIGGARPLLEGGERRSPASPQGVARFFCCAVGSFY